MKTLTRDEWNRTPTGIRHERDRKEFATLEDLLALARKLPPMTRAQRREQAISWSYGQIVHRHPAVTRAFVADAYDRRHAPILAWFRRVWRALLP